MKENKYDNETFFDKYSQMERSKKGLDGAGEWQELKKMLPPFTGKTVLDLGCGYGWHCIYAAEQGAKRVVGTDISEKMLGIAAAKTKSENVEYQCAAMEELDFKPASFDVVLSSLALHYIEDFRAMSQKIYQWLKPGGDFVFSAEHPVFTAHGRQDWIYDKEGRIQHFPVDNYFYEGERKASFLGEEVVKYHRTLTTYLGTLLETGLQIQKMTEPMPPAEMMDLPGMAEEMRRPMMILIAASKKSGE